MLESLHLHKTVIITTFADDDHYKFNHNFSSLLKVVMVTVITVNITNFNNHYHVVILKIVSITMFCNDVHYTVFTVQGLIILFYLFLTKVK